MCALGVLVDTDLSVKAAGGLLLQLLPHCPDEVIDRIESNVSRLEPVTTMLERGLTPEDILGRALAGMEFDVLDTGEPVYRCTCSRQRVERALLSMGEKALQELPDAQGQTEVTCRFCDKVYRFSREELERLLRAAR